MKVGRVRSSSATPVMTKWVAEDLVERNPMAAVRTRRSAPSAPEAIKVGDATARLLSTAATIDGTGRHQWPQREAAW
jgi:hypothetical protein